ncbi:MAG TPA: hypothetical protein VFV38_02180 [Ktedonobacteraceae bacterium]|nr:hypothetical protein [Ktedonobacteraceae bacterium]
MDQHTRESLSRRREKDSTSLAKYSIFRERALHHYVQSRDRDILPRFVSPPVIWGLWIVLCLCLVLGWLCWNIRTPVYIAGIGMVAANTSSETSQVILFVPAKQEQSVHVGAPVQLQIGSSDPLNMRNVVAVLLTSMSPAQVRMYYHLDDTLSLLVTEPSVALIVALDARSVSANYVGSIVHAQIQIGERSLLSLLPLAG